MNCELIQRITNYLTAGGLFNPELMEHEKVRDLLIDCRDELAEPEQEPVVNEKEGSPCPEFWDWLPRAYNFAGDGVFTKYNMEVAFLAGKQFSSTAPPRKEWQAVDGKLEVETIKGTLLPQAEKQEPVTKYDSIELHVLHSHLAGMLYDFMGWLTSRRTRLCLSDSDNASPAVDAIVDFAKMRGLRLEDAQVEDWQAILTTPTPPPMTPEHLPQYIATDGKPMESGGGGVCSRPRKEWVGLTDEEIELMAHNDDEGDWNDPRYRTCWLKGYFDGGRSIETKLKELNK